MIDSILWSSSSSLFQIQLMSIMSFCMIYTYMKVILLCDTCEDLTANWLELYQSVIFISPRCLRYLWNTQHISPILTDKQHLKCFRASFKPVGEMLRNQANPPKNSLLFLDVAGLLQDFHNKHCLSGSIIIGVHDLMSHCSITYMWEQIRTWDCVKSAICDIKCSQHFVQITVKTVS
jgi:hypothetical protein